MTERSRRRGLGKFCLIGLVAVMGGCTKLDELVSVRVGDLFKTDYTAQGDPLALRVAAKERFNACVREQNETTHLMRCVVERDAALRRIKST